MQTDAREVKMVQNMPFGRMQMDAREVKRIDDPIQDNLLVNACISIAIMLCIFAVWSTCSPMMVPSRGITVTHIRHLSQRGSDTMPVALPLPNVTRLGLQKSDIALLLFPRWWQTAAWSRVVFRFNRYPYDQVIGIDVHPRAERLRTLVWVGDRLVLDTALNETVHRFKNLGIPCKGSYTTLGVAFLRKDDGRWEESVVVRASRLVRAFPLVKIQDGLWIAGKPSAADQWRGRCRHIGDIPGNVMLFGPLAQPRMDSYV